MQISFSPIRADGALSVSVSGDVLTVNGQRLDLGALHEGGRLPAAAIPSAAFASDVTRHGGALHLTLILPHSADAPEAVLFPETVTLSDGPCTAPGLVDHDGEVIDAVIDWAQVITPAAAIEAARAEWRASRAVSKLDLLLALVAAGAISEESAMSTGIPAEFEQLVAAMPNPPHAEMRIRWAHLVDVPRMHPLILAVQSALGWTDEQVDALFGWP